MSPTTSFSRRVWRLFGRKACQGVREVWEQRRHWYGDEFQDWVDGEAERGNAHAMYPGQAAESRQSMDVAID